MLSFNLFVIDLDESITFYTAGLGAVLVEQGAGYAQLQLAGHTFKLAVKPENTPDMLGATPLCFQLDTGSETAQASLVNQAEQAGATIGLPGTATDPYFETPKGRVCNVVDVNGFYWSVTGR